jgi:isopenicillin-N epimerase
MNTPTLKSQYLLDPSVIFLNHGSFGATPKPVFDQYQAWQRELEYQPVEFLGRRLTDLLADSRQSLAQYLHTQRDNLVYVPNATTAINIVARSLNLKPDDQVLGSNHEYGAMDRTWRFLSQKQGFSYVTANIPLPVTTTADFVDLFWSHITINTRVIFLSHITSPTALIFPIKEIIKRARQLGIITIIDGAHAPGQIKVDLTELDVDFYTGNLHKWLSAPKGAAFLYAHPRCQHLIEPLIVSWGWQSDAPGPSRFVDYLEWPGTQDFSAYLSVPSAIQFQADNQWDVLSSTCHALLTEFRKSFYDSYQLQPLSPPGQDWHYQLEAFPLPPSVDVANLKATLYDSYRIEVPTISWQDRKFIRVSVQAYNSESDLSCLLSALNRLIDK